MTVDARDHLAGVLSKAGARARFSASRTAPTDDLQVEVRGLGPLVLPVSEEQAVQLCALARPARYGQGERTLLDPAVRNTWEIPKSRVKIDQRRWRKTMTAVIEGLRKDLGLPDGCRLVAELHSMLVYAPGQFFLPHQDSEKDDAMVGSLVVTLPSAFTGGALEVEHRGEVATYRGSKKALSVVAFYSDCRHQIKPVKSGHRTVLTYNLMRRGDASLDAAPAGNPEMVEELAGYLDQHFKAPASPSRLVYLLDHDYTPSGLSWSGLKGADVGRVSMLRSAAERAGCEAVLALADVHQTWSTFEAQRWRPRYGWSGDSRWDEDDDSFDEGATDDYELDELIESAVTIESWLSSPGGKSEKVGLSIPEGELCASTASDDLSPYSSQYEGYMGNWGNTLDRWYHRGALVVWPTGLAFASRAEASPSWALDALSARVRAGEAAAARHEAATLAPFWERAAVRVEAKGFFTKALRTARLLQEPSTAAMLLRPFRPEMLAPSHAKALSALVEAYGERWAADLVGTWSAGHRRYSPHGPTTQAWIVSLPRLGAALADCGDPGRSAARLLLRDSWTWLAGAIQQSLRSPSPGRRDQTLTGFGPTVAAVLTGAARVGAADLVDEVTGFLCPPDDELVGCATEVLRAVPAAGWATAGLDAVAEHCGRALDRRLARPPRLPDDWSIHLPTGCRCELCGQLDRFLADPARRVFEWPLAKDRRAHIHSRISVAELPVSHDTRRKGRPYTLVLTKTAALFERERQARLRDEENLTWIRGGRAPRRRRSASLA